jgi:glycerophosphoryl diester phosphodiesterase
MIVLAHRGERNSFLENTISSFQKAEELGAKYLEADLRLTKDNRIVVIHDKNLKRTHGSNHRVSGLTLEELKKVSARNDKGSEVPELNELLSTARVPINLDIKSWKIAAPVLVSEIKKFSSKVLICSWNPFVLKKIRTLDKNISLGIVFAPFLAPFLSLVLNLLSFLSLSFLTIPLKIVSKKNVERCHKQGFQVFVYNVDDETTARRLKDLGIDGIITNNKALYNL